MGTGDQGPEYSSAAGPDEGLYVLVEEDMENEPPTRRPHLNKWCWLAVAVVAVALVVTLVVVLLGGSEHSDTAPTKPTTKVLWLSDLHLDVYYNGSLSHKCACNTLQYRQSHTNMSDSECAAEAEHINAYSKPGCDSSLALVQSMLADASTILPEPDLIVITG